MSQCERRLEKIRSHSGTFALENIVPVESVTSIVCCWMSLCCSSIMSFHSFASRSSGSPCILIAHSVTLAREEGGVDEAEKKTNSLRYGDVDTYRKVVTSIRHASVWVYIQIDIDIHIDVEVERQKFREGEATIRPLPIGWGHNPPTTNYIHKILLFHNETQLHHMIVMHTLIRELLWRHVIMCRDLLLECSSYWQIVGICLSSGVGPQSNMCYDIMIVWRFR